MKTLRLWATPLTIGSFLIMGVTGVLMFFHLDSGLNKLVHEWAGLVMVAGVGAHLILNFRAFKTYFKRPIAMLLMGAGALVLALSFVSFGGQAEGPGGGVRAAMMAMNNARIETLADLAGQDSATVLAKLGAAGFDATAETTVSSLSGGDRAAQDQIIGVIFAE